MKHVLFAPLFSRWEAYAIYALTVQYEDADFTFFNVTSLLTAVVIIHIIQLLGDRLREPGGKP
jgi:hypothetical protein